MSSFNGGEMEWGDEQNNAKTTLKAMDCWDYALKS
jgi:hypothetical protein